MEYHGEVTLLKEEQMRNVTIDRFRHGELSRAEAALKLNVSERQVSRITKKVKEKGIAGIKHGNCGKVPWNKLDQNLLDQYVKLYKEKYFRFNYLHAYEMIQIHEGLSGVSYDSFRKACRKAGIGKTKKRRPSKVRLVRERFAEEGYMWQMDGSPEKWNLKDKWSLVALIDDATSRIPNASLEPSETTWSCMNVVRKAIEEHGRPEFILTDNAGWSSSSCKRRQFSQFERACRELDITVITTSSPQSKGRIERLNRTMQDRLIPELDLYGIKKRKDANRYLNQCFIPDWNSRFTVTPKSKTNRYRPLPDHINLDDIFCIKTKRIVNRNHTICYQNKIYQIKPQHSLRGKEIEVLQYQDNSISVKYGDTKIECTEIKPQKRVWRKSS